MRSQQSDMAVIINILLMNIKATHSNLNKPIANIKSVVLNLTHISAHKKNPRCTTDLLINRTRNSTHWYFDDFDRTGEARGYNPTLPL